MKRILMILEVSQKQDYIFSSKQLKENITHSEQIAYVTDSSFFKTIACDCYDEAENLIYTGGGHAVLQFQEQSKANIFARKITRAVLEMFPGIELFVKQQPYQDISPKENLESLTKALERKKSFRKSSFRYLSFGVEKLDAAATRPIPYSTGTPVDIARSLPIPPEHYRFPNSFEELAGKDNFLAVVHIDGNAMGTRVAQIYSQYANPDAEWKDCCGSLQRFSDGIAQDFKAVFQEMVYEVIAQLNPGELLPLRPLILAGDDVCFVTSGNIGLECARVFLERLAMRSNSEDGICYAACAGVALVHRKYPFHRAYELAEELCSSAKQFGAARDAKGRVSAIDWHIEFGEMKDGLEDLRTDYIAEDGSRLTLRPMAVSAPEDVRLEYVRTFDFFKHMWIHVKQCSGNIARGKIKELRSAMKQGETEALFFFQDKELSRLLPDFRNAPYTDPEYAPQSQMKGIYASLDGREHCILFDAVELMDHYKPFGEEMPV